ncbi:TetR/AcrR family transcriptional regulator [Amycolatopsis pigmentata]|uniref:TetR/AcrR family transcriptional regulator n=1 Tax=Amycolatopsis pigmentata TaxID=450801 RepID=A0ABW5FW57_9PSEU
MDPAEPRAAAKRRGRRPAGHDTRTALLEAARQVFAENGYEGATVRAIAARAGVDAAMVNHWFGGKETLFAQAVLQIPSEVQELAASVLAGDLDTVGERIARGFVTAWDSTAGGIFPALVRSLTGHDQAAAGLRDFLVKHMFGRIVARLEVDQPLLRANLCASQLVGIGMVRYVAKFEPLASAPADVLVAAVGPTLQRYLTAELNLPAT